MMNVDVCLGNCKNLTQMFERVKYRNAVQNYGKLNFQLPSVSLTVVG